MLEKYTYEFVLRQPFSFDSKILNSYMAIVLEAFSAAAQNYGLRNEQYIENYPYLNFQYLVIFNLIGFGNQDQLATLIQSADIGQPSWEMRPANHYNYRRQVKTRVTYGDTTMSIFDVADGKTMRFLKTYQEYYSLDPTGDQFGYNLLEVGNQDAYIESVEIYKWQFPVANLTVLHFPKIRDIGNISMSMAGNEPVEVSITMLPEWIEYFPRVAAPPVRTAGNSDR